MHRAPPPVTGASNPSRTSPGPIEHKNRRQPPVQQTPTHNNDGELRALREEARDTSALEWLKPAFSEAPYPTFLAVPPSTGHRGPSWPMFLPSPPLRRVYWDDTSTTST
ncbi:hypothetical protein MRX96_030690 [Rhipicephalus microplus]